MRRIFHHQPDTRVSQLTRSYFDQRNRRRFRIGKIFAGHYLEERSQISTVRAIGPTVPSQENPPSPGGIMPSGGNAPRRRFQATDPGVVSRNTDRPATIAADARGGHERRNRRRLSSTRSARGAREIPWIVCATVKRVVGLPRHQELRRIGDAQHDGASSLKAGDKRGISRRNIALAQSTSRFATHACNIDAALDTDRHAVQRPQRTSCGYQRVGSLRLVARFLRT